MKDKTPVDNNIVEHNIFKAIRGKCINDDSAVLATKEVVGFIKTIQAKHKEDIKQAVINTYMSYSSILQSVSETQVMQDRAEQYYKENYEEV